MADPYNDNGSLRPHALPSHGIGSDDLESLDWQPPWARSRKRAWRWPLAVGIVIGVGASLPLTGWAVRTHRWPGSGPAAQAAAAAAPLQSTPHAAAQPVSGTLALDGAAPAPLPSSNEALASASASSAGKDAVTGKVHKKRKGPGHRASHQVEVTDATGSASDPATVAEEPEPGSSKPRAHKAAGAHAAAVRSSDPAPPVEDQAAAELSTSLK